MEIDSFPFVDVFQCVIRYPKAYFDILSFGNFDIFKTRKIIFDILDLWLVWPPSFKNNLVSWNVDNRLTPPTQHFLIVWKFGIRIQIRSDYILEFWTFEPKLQNVKTRLVIFCWINGSPRQKFLNIFWAFEPHSSKEQHYFEILFLPWRSTFTASILICWPQGETFLDLLNFWPPGQQILFTILKFWFVWSLGKKLQRILKFWNV